MIPACIFAYSGDSLPLRECVRGAKLAGLLPVVFDDAHNHMGRSVWAWIESQGGMYFHTDFNRRGNLNGTECAAGIARALHGTMTLTKTRQAFKIDADTIIQRPERFQGITSGICSTLIKRREAFGCCYTLTKDAAQRVAAELESMPDDAIPEDLAIWQAIKRLKIRHELHDFDPKGGAFSAVPASFDPADCMKFDVLTFGNRPTGGWKDRKMEITLAMKKLNDWNLRLAQNQK